MLKHPLKFSPIYQQRVWGGRRLETTFERALPDTNSPFGESWEICDRPEANSMVSGGPFAGKSLGQLWRDYRSELFGHRFDDLPNFPILCKILDATEKLSLQVHPPAAVAESLAGEPKNELWYIADAGPEAELYIGLKPGVDRQAFEQAIANGTVEGLLHVVRPKVGDFVYIPSGRLHAIGAGLLIYEIQQNSDTTYRVFDWNRIGLDGQPRQLHVEQSLASINFADIEPEMDSPHSRHPELLVRNSDFSVRRYQAPAGATLEATFPDEFSIWTVVSGSIHLADSGEPGACQKFNTGDFFILPRDGAQLIAGGQGATYLETIA